MLNIAPHQSSRFDLCAHILRRIRVYSHEPIHIIMHYIRRQTTFRLYKCSDVETDASKKILDLELERLWLFPCKALVCEVTVLGSSVVDWVG